MNQFNLIDNSWIPVRYLDGKQCLISLETAFVDATRIADLNCQPHERISLMRLLVCITQTVFAPPVTDEDWEGYAESMATDIPAYLNRDQVFQNFNLLGNGPRFLQLPLTETKQTPKLDFLEFKFGSNPRFIDHTAGEIRKHEPHQIALNLLCFQNFYVGGSTGSPANGGVSGNGPALKMLHTYLIGGSLKHTIVLNCLDRQQIRELGVPFWETEAKLTSNCSSGYLNRLVPRSCKIWIRKGLTHFRIEQGVKHEEFEAYREPSATVKVGNDKKLHLLRAEYDKGIWRDLHLITCMKNFQEENATGPKSLQSHLDQFEEDSDISLWSGELIKGIRAKIEGSQEAFLTIPYRLFSEHGQSTYSAGISYSDKISSILGFAVDSYAKTLEAKSSRAKKSAHRKGLINVAKRYFWNALDQQVDTLLEIVRHPEARKEDFGKGYDPWTLTVNCAARMAFKDTCPRRSPRQLKAYAAGLRTLCIKNKQPLN